MKTNRQQINLGPRSHKKNKLNKQPILLNNVCLCVFRFSILDLFFFCLFLSVWLVVAFFVSFWFVRQYIPEVALACNLVLFLIHRRIAILHAICILFLFQCHSRMLFLSFTPYLFRTFRWWCLCNALLFSRVELCFALVLCRFFFSIQLLFLFLFRI